MSNSDVESFFGFAAVPGEQREALLRARQFIAQCGDGTMAMKDEIETELAAIDAHLAASVASRASSEPVATMDDAIAAGDGTLHGAIDYWQGRALAAEAARDVDETNKVLADNYLRDTASIAPAAVAEPSECLGTMITKDEFAKRWDEAYQRKVDQDVTPEYLQWLQDSAPREGVSGNVAWNAGVAWERRAGVASLVASEPLTDEQIVPMFHAAQGMKTEGEKDPWFWFAWGVEFGERAHGISAGEVQS